VSAPLQNLFEGKGVVAFRDVSVPAAQKWATFPFGKGQITPAPFFLVWDGISYSNKKFPWPWQLAKIQLASFDELYGAAFPKSTDVPVRKGFEVFRQHCISCHSINLAGGTAGMEMNVPKNITEYWNQDHFTQFVRNPESYRARAKMTPKEHLTSEEMGLLWTYLKAMGNEKICSDMESCKKVK
jgi:mono/diheme cytochrome c family protein